MFKFHFLAAIAAVSLMVNTSSAQVVLAAWDTFGDAGGTTVPALNVVITAPHTIVPDISNFSPSSTFSFGGDVRDIRGNRGSDDGTFGSAPLPSANVDGTPALNDSLRMNNGAGTDGIEMLINITAGDDLNFSSFHFDSGNNPNSVGDTWSDVTVSFIDGAGVVTELGSSSLLATSEDGSEASNTSNYLDVDVDAGGVSLAAGETGAFRLSFFETRDELPDGNGIPTHTSAVHLDNFAIMVVEPATGPEHGDVNLDGDVNFLDIAPFINVLAAGGSSAEESQADCNGDGGVSFLDISPFIQALAGAGS